MKISRIKQLKIKNFRGFKNSSGVLNTDADIVLLTGPNGFGKSSLVDAIRILLTGYRYKDDEELIYRHNGKKQDKGYIEAKVDCFDDNFKTNKIKVKIEPKKNSNKTILKPEGIDWGTERTKGISAKASFFYEEFLPFLFDEEKAEMKLSDFLIEEPHEITNIEKKLRETLNDIKDFEKKIKKNIKIESEQELNSQRKQTIKEIQENWEKLSNICEKYNVNLPDIPQYKTREIYTILQKTEDAITEKMDKTEQLSMLLNTPLNKEWLKKEDPIKEINLKIKDTNKQIEDATQIFISLDKKLNYFNNPKTSEPDLLQIVETLCELGDLWLDFPKTNIVGIKCPDEVLEWLESTYNSLFLKDKNIAQILKQWLNKVSIERIKIAKTLLAKNHYKANLEKDLKILKRIKELNPSKTDITTLVKHYNNENYQINKEPSYYLDSVYNSVEKLNKIEQKINENQEKIKNQEKYSKTIKYIGEIKNILNGEITRKKSAIKLALDISEGTSEKLGKLLNKIFNRFRIVEGLYPITIKPQKTQWKIETNSEIPLNALSSGQRSQLGFSLLVALNIILENKINHRIITLDDTVATFDMAQLSREATILRQLAYGAGENEKQNNTSRRQLFIVSHNEEMTLRLKKFLTPPEGRKMHILNFTNWNQNKGPTIEQLELLPSRPMNSKSRKELAEFMDQQAEINF